MKKTSDTPADALSTEPSEYALGLEEFCRRLSTRDNRVELISGFFAWAKRNHRVHDLESNFQALYEDFAGMPA